MRDYTELLKSVHCCVDCEESQCEICPRGDTPFSYIECKRKLSDDAADAIEELLAAVPHWISVEEQLPEFVMNDSGCICTKKLLFRTEYKTIHLGYAVRSYHNIETAERFEQIVVDRWYDQSGDMIEDVTHWMPFPSAPKEENKR